jgi:hypothetical protein
VEVGVVGTRGLETTVDVVVQVAILIFTCAQVVVSGFAHALPPPERRWLEDDFLKRNVGLARVGGLVG